MWVYLSIKTSKIKDEKLKEKLWDYDINSSYLNILDFDIRNFLEDSNDDKYMQILKSDKLQDAINEWKKDFLFFDKKIRNLFKLLSCIIISSYSNKANQHWKENTFEVEVNKITLLYEDFLKKAEEFFNEDKDISEIYEGYYDEIMSIAEYIDSVLERFETSYKNEESTQSELDYLLGEIYSTLRLLNLLKIAKKYDLELVYW